MFFWNSLAFSMIQRMLAIWSLVPLPFLNPAWTSGISRFAYCWTHCWTPEAAIKGSSGEQWCLEIHWGHIADTFLPWFWCQPGSPAWTWETLQISQTILFFHISYPEMVCWLLFQPRERGKSESSDRSSFLGSNITPDNDLRPWY